MIDFDKSACFNGICFSNIKMKLKKDKYTSNLMSEFLKKKKKKKACKVCLSRFWLLAEKD